MSASSRAPPSEMRTYGRPIARAIDLAIHFLARGFGELQRREALPQLLDFCRFVFLAQLLANRLHLLAQEQLPLPLTQLLLHLRLDLLLGVEHADLTLDVHQHAA